MTRLPSWLQKLLLSVTTLAAGAVTFVLMRREGDRATGRGTAGDATPSAAPERPPGHTREPEKLAPQRSRPAAARSAEPAAATTPQPTASRTDVPRPAAVDPDAEAEEPVRCAATTASGDQCSRNADEGGIYCWQHAE